MPLVKPAPWGVNRAAVDPEYQGLWRGLRIAVAWADTPTGLARNIVTGELGTLEGADLGRSTRPLGSVWTRSTTTQGSHIDIPFQIDPSATPFTAVGVLHVDAAPSDEINLHQHDGTGVGRNWIQHAAAANRWGTFLGGSQLDSTVQAVVGEMNMPVVRFDGGSTVVVGANGDWSNTVDSARTPESATGDHIWMDHKAANQAPANIPGYGFYIWDRYLSDTELDLIYSDPFGLIRPATVSQVSPTTSLYATGDGTIVDVVNENDQAGA